MTPWEHFSADFHDKKIAVFGLGKQGGGAAVASVFAQAGSKVTVFDQQSESALQESLPLLSPGVNVHLDMPEPELFGFDLVVKNPAVPYSHISVQKALENGVGVVGETALMLRYVRDHAIGITGTRGKTTTTTLIGKLLAAAGLETVVGGNIPQHPALSLLPQVGENTWVVLEISSFQLESFPFVQVSPKIAVATNIYPDHLNRYESLEKYAETKAEIFRFQKPGDVAIYGGEAKWFPLFESRLQNDVEPRVVTSEWVEQIKSRFTTQLHGEHNWHNIATAAVVAKILSLPDSVLQSVLDGFAGVPFRQEKVAEIHGVQIINDTTSTTPIALEKALQSFPTGEFVVITGGTSKKLPVELRLLQALSQRPTAIVFVAGSATEELKAAAQSAQISLPVVAEVKTLAEAVHTGLNAAQEKSTKFLVFSPGATSFEMYANEFERGRHFNELIHQLAST